MSFSSIIPRVRFITGSVDGDAVVAIDNVTFLEPVQSQPARLILNSCIEFLASSALLNVWNRLPPPG